MLQIGREFLNSSPNRAAERRKNLKHKPYLPNHSLNCNEQRFSIRWQNIFCFMSFARCVFHQQDLALLKNSLIPQRCFNFYFTFQKYNVLPLWCTMKIPIVGRSYLTED